MVQILLILNGICLASKQNIRQKDDQKNHRTNQKEENIFTSEIQSNNLNLLIYVLPPKL